MIGPNETFFQVVPLAAPPALTPGVARSAAH